MKTKRFPIGTGGGRRPDRIERKRAEADARNSHWGARPISEQLRAIDARFGKGIGATRQRARLTRVL